MALCDQCFREKGAETVCPFCGYDPTGWEKKHPLALRPQSILNGRYIVGRVLGQGGFGITYIALDYQAKERVAVKEYFPTEFAGRTGGTRVQIYSEEREQNFAYGKTQFLEEARTLAAVTGSENIVRIHSYFEENGTAYFTMDYVEGLSLDQFIRRNGGPLTAARAAELLLPLMGAMDTVHRKGIVHRDIAPDNIIITPEGKARLIDFGAARYSTGEKSKSLDVILKHGFAPMEQYTRRGRQGPWTDVYAMAATYYYALTGKVPPDAIERIAEDTLELPSAAGSDLSAGEERVLLKALAVQAPDRWQNMGEFRAAMQAVRDAADAEALHADRERRAREEKERLAREKAEQAAREKQEKAAREAQKKAEREAAHAARQTEREAAHAAKQAERKTRQSAGSGAKKSRLPLVLAAVLVLALGIFGATRFIGKSTPAVTATPAATEAAAEPAAEIPAVKAPTALADLAPGTYKIGVAIYQFDDNFMTLYRNELLDYFKSLETDDVKFDVTIVDGKNDIAEQSNQIDSFITLGMDAIILNLVQTFTADAAINKIVAAGIPCILINREPLGDNGDESYAGILDNATVCYVGADARQSGTFQGEIIRDLPNHGDINGDGKVSFIMIEGDPLNVDAYYRTEFSIKALIDAGIGVECLDDQVGNWSMAKSQEICAIDLAKFGDQIEVIFCNNDGMALGAYAAITAADRHVGEDIYLVGIDALDECVEMINCGEMTGTVLNDHVGQSHTAVDVTVAALAGQDINNYYWVDYVKVTAPGSDPEPVSTDAESAAPADDGTFAAKAALAPEHPVTPFGLLYKNAADRGIPYTEDEIRLAYDRTVSARGMSWENSFMLLDALDGHHLLCQFVDGLLIRVSLHQKNEDGSSSSVASMDFWGDLVWSSRESSPGHDFFLDHPEKAYALATAALDNPSVSRVNWTSSGVSDLPFHYSEMEPLNQSFGVNRIDTTTGYALDTPVTDLTSRTYLYMQMTIANCPADYPFGEHVLFARGTDGNWVTVGTFRVLPEQADGRAVLYQFRIPSGLSDLAVFAGPFPMEGPLVSGYTRNTSYSIDNPRG